MEMQGRCAVRTLHDPDLIPQHFSERIPRRRLAGSLPELVADRRSGQIRRDGAGVAAATDHLTGSPGVSPVFREMAPASLPVKR
jgi:hypothetical protein